MTDPIRLEIFKHLFASVAEEMGVTLGRTGYSPNIKERLDYSCAVFMGDGRLLAQAAHIPVHLGAMPASVRAAIEHCAPFAPGDVVILNDPYLGGTHLPDITLVSPVFVGNATAEVRSQKSEVGDLPSPSSDLPPPPSHPHFFVASRAHHADIGGLSPGSMPLSTEIYQEGVIIPPLKIVEAGRRNQAVWQLLLRNVRTPEERQGDLAAQLAAHAIGARRLDEIVARYGLAETQHEAEALIAYTERMVRAVIAAIPPGRYEFTDYLDDDGHQTDIPIRVAVTIHPPHTPAPSQPLLAADFAGTAPAVSGNLNAVRAIAESAVGYVVRCLAPADLPMNAGAFAPLRVIVPPDSLLDPRPPHAVAAGNVETSQRVVDALFGALASAQPDRIPAASQGTMNNLTFGGRHPETGQPFAYYETLGGGAGAGPVETRHGASLPSASLPGASLPGAKPGHHPPRARLPGVETRHGASLPGASGIHVHMSNTRNTPIEALEFAFPIRIEQYSLRRGSGGRGRHFGGEGLRRDIRFLVSARVTVLSERRRRAPWGLQGGQPGARGRNVLIKDGREEELPGKFTRQFEAGEVLSLQTPGGGGWGDEENSNPPLRLPTSDL
jgi:N-methylhydantoinase B